MKVLLLNSPWVNTENEYGIKAGTRWAALRKKESSMPYFPFPYFMASATAVLKEAGFDAHIKDAVAEEMSREDCLNYVERFMPDILVIEAFTPSIYADLSFMEKAKRRTGCHSVFCGAHPTALPGEVLKNQFMDFVLMGEYDYTLRELARSLSSDKKDFKNISGLAYKESGAIKINPRRRAIEDLDELPFPETDELPMLKYNEPFSRFYPNAKIVTSRGCPYSCIFCVEPFMYEGVRYKTRSVRLIIEEIKRLRDRYGVKEIFFDDAIFTIQRAKDIAKAIIDDKVKIAWSCWMDWNIGYDDLKFLKESGCAGIKFGVESSDPEILKTAKKPVNIERIKELTNNCRKLGLVRHASFIFGLPGETKESMEKTMELAFSLDITSCQFQIATPLPGTAFFKMAQDAGWLTSRDWRDYETLSNAVVEYPMCSKKDIESAMSIARDKKVKQVLRNPLLFITYLVKLYKLKGPRGFFKDVSKKTGFVFKVLSRK